MIRFALKCENDHRFESWFQSGSAFDALQDRGLVHCPECASTVISKDLMAPKIAPKGRAEAEKVPVATSPDPEMVAAIGAHVVIAGEFPVKQHGAAGVAFYPEIFRHFPARKDRIDPRAHIVRDPVHVGKCPLVPR